MGFTMDIDTGGTFTDGFLTCGEQIQKVKVDTTPHDFTECLLNCIEAGASRFGISMEEFLKQTEVIRFSCTIGTNALIQKNGPKLGLIVTKGHERRLYAHEDPVPALGLLVARDMVEGVQSVTGSKGTHAAPIREAELRRAVRKLLEKGARILVVSLQGSGFDGSQEKTVKSLISAEYPRHYLGSVPVLLASEVSTGAQEYLRTNTVLTNAYLHPEMVRVLYKAEEDLRRHYYNKPLMIVHANGGVARVAKTKAIDTHNSGPVAGLMGALFMSRLYELNNVITVDIGGTSTDVGLILNSTMELARESDIAGIPVDVPAFHVQSVGAGGGSIASVEETSKKLRVGPQSAGALPGPACYDLGGYAPTATDADVVLGFIDPGYFLGGQRRLDKEKAAEAIEYDVAEAMGQGVEQAARHIHGQLARNAAQEIKKVLKGKQVSGKDPVLFAFGGAGGTYACEIAEILKVSRIYTFQQNSVFSAFGSSVMDVLHTYEERTALLLMVDKQFDSEAKRLFDELVEILVKRASTDMRGEGFDPGDIEFTLELDLRVKQPAFETTVASPGLRLDQEPDAAHLLSEVRLKARQAGISNPDRIQGFTVSGITLKAASLIPHFEPSPVSPGGENPKEALKGTRPVYWEHGFADTEVFERNRLTSGNIVPGPSIIEAEDTTYVIPAGWRFVVDAYLNGLIEEVT